MHKGVFVLSVLILVSTAWPADLNHDFIVDNHDLRLFSAQWLQTQTPQLPDNGVITPLSGNEIHISLLGDEGNTGRAGQFPVDLTTDALPSVMAAYNSDQVASGQTLLIHSGLYEPTSIVSPAKTLNLIGQSRSESVLASDVNPLIYNPGDGARIANLTLRGINPPMSTGITGGLGFNTGGSSGVSLFNLDIWGGQDGVYTLNARGCFISYCKIGSRWDGVQVSNGENVIIEKCYLYSTGDYKTASGQPGMQSGRALTTGDCRGLIVRDCTIVVDCLETGVKPITGSSSDIRGLTGVNIEGNTTFERCHIIVTANNARFYPDHHIVAGIRVGNNHHGASATFYNCTIEVTPSPSVPTYGVYVEDGICKLEDCIVVPPKGYQKPNAFGEIPGLGVLSVSHIDPNDSSNHFFAANMQDIFPDDFYTGYQLTWTTGNNAGASTKIVKTIGTSAKFQLANPPAEPIAQNDRFELLGMGYHDLAQVDDGRLYVKDTIYNPQLIDGHVINMN